MLLITETWHEDCNDVILKRAVPAGYQCVDVACPRCDYASVPTDRPVNRGGLALICRDNLKVKMKPLTATTTFEHLCCHVTAGNDQFMLLGVYRPGSQAATTQFFDELSAAMEQVCTYRYPIVILGDFNVHMDVIDDANAVRLTSLVESLDCMQQSNNLRTRMATLSTWLLPRVRPSLAVYVLARCYQTMRSSLSHSTSRSHL